MKRFSIFIIGFFLSAAAIAQQYTETRQLRFYPISKASDTVAAVANDGRIWYDFVTDEYRGIKNGVKFSFADASGGNFWPLEGTALGTGSTTIDYSTNLFDLAISAQTLSYFSDVGYFFEGNGTNEVFFGADFIHTFSNVGNFTINSEETVRINAADQFIVDSDDITMASAANISTSSATNTSLSAGDELNITGQNEVNIASDVEVNIGPGSGVLLDAGGYVQTTATQTEIGFVSPSTEKAYASFSSTILIENEIAGITLNATNDLEINTNGVQSSSGVLYMNGDAVNNSANLTYSNLTGRLTAVGAVSVGSAFEVPYFNGSGTVIPFFNGGTPNTMINDTDLTYTALSNQLNVPNISSSGTITGNNVTATTALTWSGGTATRIPFLGTAGLFDDDNGLTYTDGSNLVTVTSTGGANLTEVFGGEIQIEDVGGSDQLVINDEGLQFSGNTSPPQIITATGAAIVSLDNVLFTSTTAVPFAAPGPTTLYTFSIPAATLTANGQSIHFELWYEIANNANVKTVSVTIGGTAVASSGTISGATLDLGKLTGTITRNAATTGFACDTEIEQDNAGASTTTMAFNNAANITWSSANTMAVSATGTTNNDIIGIYFKVWYSAQ